MKQPRDLRYFLIIPASCVLWIVLQPVLFGRKRRPDLAPKYARPVSPEMYRDDSLNFVLQIDSVIASKNKTTKGPKVKFAFIDTIIYSQPGDQVFIAYIRIYEPNARKERVSPAYLSSSKREGANWYLVDGPPHLESYTGSFPNIKTLKKEIRAFYFGNYSFLPADSTKKNYFWLLESDQYD